MQRNKVLERTPLTQRWHALLCLFVVTLAMATASMRAEDKIPSLRIGSITFSNIIVREVADRSVTIAHSRGMATLSIDKMSYAEKEALGLVAPEPEKPAGSRLKFTGVDTEKVVSKFRGLGWFGSTNENSLSDTQAMNIAAQLETPEGVQHAFKNLPPIRYTSLIAPVAAYFLISMCFVVICSKTGKPAPLLGWIPVAQMFALFRAAGMSPFWFVVALLNVFLHITLLGVAWTKGLSSQTLTICGAIALSLFAIHSLGWIIWCFKISKARGKSPLLGLLLLLPGINLLALAYLTLSGGGAQIKAAPLVAAAPQPAGLRLMF
jgi:hypothetical protein